MEDKFDFMIKLGHKSYCTIILQKYIMMLNVHKYVHIRKRNVQKTSGKFNEKVVLQYRNRRQRERQK